MTHNEYRVSLLPQSPWNQLFSAILFWTWWDWQKRVWDIEGEMHQIKVVGSSNWHIQVFWDIHNIMYWCLTEKFLKLNWIDGIGLRCLFCRFFVFVLIYVIGGILFLRFYRGASGVEMFPNYEFWKDLPFLIKVNQN